jgi:hypothetical protein
MTACYPYTADFAYIEPAMNLHIDIEVDEPYDYTSRQPRHYIGLETEKKRNRFFTDRLWIVIRFSEEQVVRWPDSCFDTLRPRRAKILGSSSPLTKFGCPHLPEVVLSSSFRLIAESSSGMPYRTVQNLKNWFLEVLVA